MQVHHVHLGDTLTPIGCLLKRPDGSIVDLTGKTLKFSMFDSAGAAVVNEAAASITDAEAGEGQYDFLAADVDTAGTYNAYFVVVDGAEKEHFPPQKGELQVIIHAN